MEDEWNKVQTEIWVPENKGDEISGVYLNVQQEVGENKSTLYTVEVEDGKTTSFWGSRVLDGKMTAVKIGQQVKVLFLGKVKPEAGREYKDYDVFFKSEKVSEPEIKTQKV